MHLLTPLLILATLAARAPVQDSIPLQLTRLELDLQLNYEQAALEGSATLTVRNQSARAAAGVPLLLNRLMRVTGVRTGPGRAAAFQQRIAVFEDEPVRQVNAIWVPLRIAPGQSVTLTIRYAGILVGYTETGSLYIQDHIAPEFTILREDAYAFPVLGRPSWASNQTIPRESFHFRVRVTVPADQTVATGGGTDSLVAAGPLTTWLYSSREPVPFLNITIAPYSRLADSSVTIYHFPADSAGARQLGLAIHAALGRLVEWYGALPRAPHLVVMEIPEGYGSQASLTGGIIQTADAFRSREELPQIYHELSHLWNVPDLDHPSSRWNEGLASFLQWRLAADLDGWSDWEGRLARTTARALEACAEPAPCHDTPMAGYGAAGATDRSYGVGLLLFRSLQVVMGTDRFDRAYRRFWEQHGAGGRVSDLVATFHAESPATDAVFRDWLTSTNWYRRLAAGETLQQMIDSYSRP